MKSRHLKERLRKRASASEANSNQIENDEDGSSSSTDNNNSETSERNCAISGDLKLTLKRERTVSAGENKSPNNRNDDKVTAEDFIEESGQSSSKIKRETDENNATFIAEDEEDIDVGSEDVKDQADKNGPQITTSSSKNNNCPATSSAVLQRVSPRLINSAGIALSESSLTTPRTSILPASSLTSAAGTSRDILTDSRNVYKVKRFLCTLIQFGGEISADIGEKVKELTFNLVAGEVTVEEFHQLLQEATNYPLRPFVMPFLKANVPLICNDLANMALINKTTPLGYLKSNQEFLLSVTTGQGSVNSSGDLSDIFKDKNGKSPALTSTTTSTSISAIMSTSSASAGGKKRPRDASSTSTSSSTAEQRDASSPIEIKRPKSIDHSFTTHSPPALHLRQQQRVQPQTQWGQHHSSLRTSTAGSAFFQQQQLRLQVNANIAKPSVTNNAEGPTAKSAPGNEDEWGNIHVMLDCILGMVDKTKKALSILQQRRTFQNQQNQSQQQQQNPFNNNSQIQVDSSGDVMSGSSSSSAANLLLGSSNSAKLRTNGLFMGGIQPFSSSTSQSHPLASNSMASGTTSMNEILLATIRSAEDRVAEVKRQAEDAVAEVKRAALAELQKALGGTKDIAGAASGGGPLRTSMSLLPGTGRPGSFNGGSGSSISGNSNEQISPKSSISPIGVATKSSEFKCWNCGRSASETCGGCNIAKYCTQFCQHKDWQNHQRICAGNSINNNSLASVVAAAAAVNGPSTSVGGSSSTLAASAGFDLKAATGFDLKSPASAGFDMKTVASVGFDLKSAASAGFDLNDVLKMSKLISETRTKIAGISKLSQESLSNCNNNIKKSD